jgi:hypothetical protein
MMNRVGFVFVIWLFVVLFALSLNISQNAYVIALLIELASMNDARAANLRDREQPIEFACL